MMPGLFAQPCRQIGYLHHLDKAFDGKAPDTAHNRGLQDINAVRGAQNIDHVKTAQLRLTRRGPFQFRNRRGKARPQTFHLARLLGQAKFDGEPVKPYQPRVVCPMPRLTNRLTESGKARIGRQRRMAKDFVKNMRLFDRNEFFAAADE